MAEGRMLNMNYSEKLKDPRWQKLRLQVFERDGWCCQRCGNDENTLTVHHLSYLPGIEPWDYKLQNFMTLCQECHDHEYANRRNDENILLQTLRRKGFLAGDLIVLASAFQNLSIINTTEVMVSIIEFMFSDKFMSEYCHLYWEDCERRAEMIREVRNGSA